MSIKYGLIAEDVSDIKVIKSLANKVAGKSISTAHFVGKGCGSIRRKAIGWCRSLEVKGCSRILLVHDRDDADADKLRKDLQDILVGAPQAIKTVIVPVEELEAWLLSDQCAIQRALKLNKPIKEEHHPERIGSPKEYLGAAIYKVAKSVQYVNAVHNPLIAIETDVSKIKNKCPSFMPFVEFFSAKGKGGK